MDENIVIGVTYQNHLIISIGDTLCLTPIIEEISKQKNQLINVSASIPELFFNNPYVIGTNTDNPTINLSPCLSYDCNIVKYYASQLNIELPKNSKPKIYLSDEEKKYGRYQLSEFEGFKRIAVSTTTSTDCKDLRYEYILPLLNRLKDRGYILIGVGKGNLDARYDFNKSFFNRTSLRESCSIINTCHLYLGVDAGLYHIAAALDVPQVVFFRNNQSANNSYPNTYNIESRIKCEGECLARHLHVCQAENRCMDNFDLERYYNLITKVLPI
jgi:ADP-heptose:LPS heptosyltransferase